MSTLDRPIIHGIIWDCDGTLLDTESLATIACNNVLETLNSTKKCEGELQQRLIGLPDHEWCSILLDECQLTDVITIESFIEKYLQELDILFEKVQVLPGALSLLSHFTSLGLPQAMATSSCTHAVTQKRKAQPVLFSHVDKCIVMGDDVELKRGKPAPDIFLLAAKRLGIDPKHCLVFEDSPYGIEAALAAGMHAIAIPEHMMSHDKYKGAHQILKTLEHFDLTSYTYVPPTKTSTSTYTLTSTSASASTSTQ